MGQGTPHRFEKQLPMQFSVRSRTFLLQLECVFFPCSSAELVSQKSVYCVASDLPQDKQYILYLMAALMHTSAVRSTDNAGKRNRQ